MKGGCDKGMKRIKITRFITNRWIEIGSWKTYAKISLLRQLEGGKMKCLPLFDLEKRLFHAYLFFKSMWVGGEISRSFVYIFLCLIMNFHLLKILFSQNFTLASLGPFYNYFLFYLQEVSFGSYFKEGGGAEYAVKF